MKSRIELLRVNARQCEGLARSSITVGGREVFEEMALVLDQAADRLERRSRQRQKAEVA